MGITREVVEEKLKDFCEREECLGILLFLPEQKKFISMEFSYGDNLLSEDRSEGYDGYINYVYHEWDEGEFNSELDGGEYLYNSTEKNYGDNIANAVYDVLECEFTEVPEFIPLQTY